MTDSYYVSMLSKDGLQDVLSHSLSDLSEKTQIPESTLKRYRDGRSDMDSMPLRIIQALTDFAANKFDVFDVPNNYFLNGDMFYRVLKCVRESYNQFDEIYNAQIYFNWQQYLFINNMQKAPMPRYFFIEDLEFLLNKKPKDIQFDLLMTVGLMHGVRFVFNLDNVPLDFKELHNDAAVVVTGGGLKLITKERLNEMKLTLDQHDGIIVDDFIMGTKFLIEDNVKLMILRDAYIFMENDDEIFLNILISFIETNKSNDLISFIMLEEDERLIFIKEWFKNNVTLSVRLQNASKLDESFLAIIISFFQNKNYDTFLVRYV